MDFVHVLPSAEEQMKGMTVLSLGTSEKQILARSSRLQRHIYMFSKDLLGAFIFGAEESIMICLHIDIFEAAVS